MIPFIQTASDAKLPYVVRSQDSGYPKREYEGNFWVLVIFRAFSPLIVGYIGVFM